MSVERDRQHYSFIQSMLRHLDDPAATAVCGDALRFISKGSKEFDFIFADPPYALREIPEIPERVMASKLLAPRGLFVLEHGKQNDFSNHPDFLEHRAYGSVNFSFFRRPETSTVSEGNETPTTQEAE